MMAAKMFEVSVSPHIRDNDSVNKIMWRVVLAMIPISIASLVFYGWNALRLVSVSITVCLLTEFDCNICVEVSITI